MSQWDLSQWSQSRHGQPSRAAAPAPVATKTSARESLAQRAERLKAEREQKAKSTPTLLALQDEAGQSRVAALKADPSKPSRARPGGSEDRVNHVLAAGLAMHPGSALPASADRLADESGSEVALGVQVPDDDGAADDYFAGGAEDSDDDLHDSDDDLHAQIMALG